MKKWTKNSAISYLNKQNGVEIRSKVVIASRGLSGLTACSALDYLCNHCNYTYRK